VLLDVQLEALVRRVRQAIRQELVIVVMGWRNNHHTLFTRGLSVIDMVKFYDHENPPKGKFGPTVGLVLCAEYVKHSFAARVKDKRMCSTIVHYHTVIQVLESCSDLLVCPCGPFACDTSKATAEKSPLDAIPEAVLEILTRPPRRSDMTQENSTMAPLVQAFNDAKDKEGRVGIRIFKRILKQCGVKETPQKLVRDRWIIPCVKEGNDKTGSYKAGPKLIEASESALPKDPIDHAKWLLSKKPMLLAKYAELQAAYDIESFEVTARHRAEITELNARHQAEMTEVHSSHHVLLDPIQSEITDINTVEAVYNQLEAMFVKRPSS